MKERLSQDGVDKTNIETQGGIDIASGTQGIEDRANVGAQQKLTLPR